MSAGRSSGRGRHQLHRNDRAQLRTAARPAVDTSTLNRGLLIPLQQRTARHGLQGYSRFIGRVGALAVALGVGVGFTTSMPGVARADDTDSSSSAESSSSEPSDPTTATDTTTSTTTSATTSTDSASPSDPASAGDSPAEGPTGIVQSSGGAQTGSYGPNATAPSSEGETDTVPTTSGASGGGGPTETAAAADATTEAAADATTEAAATPDAVAPSIEPVPAQTPVLQDDSPTGENAPATTELDPGSAGDSSVADVLDGTTSIGTTSIGTTSTGPTSTALQPNSQTFRFSPRRARRTTPGRSCSRPLTQRTTLPSARRRSRRRPLRKTRCRTSWRSPPLW